MVYPETSVITVLLFQCDLMVVFLSKLEWPILSARPRVHHAPLNQKQEHEFNDDGNHGRSQYWEAMKNSLPLN
jgi:hypothetical protein